MKTIRKLEIKYRRIPLAKENNAVYETQVDTPSVVERIAMSLLGNEDQEVFIVFLLDTQNRVMGYSEVTRGAIDACPVPVREVFKAAILIGALGIVVAHNHPSGDTIPSPEDIAVTQKLKNAAKTLDIELIDHVIVSHSSRSYSFAEHGEI